MLGGSALTLGVLGVVSGVGIMFAYDGYSMTNRLLGWVGWLGGATLGGGVGWVVLPQVRPTPDRLLLAGGGLVVGAILGRLVVPLVSWLAVVVLGFLATGLAGVVIVAGTPLVRTITAIATSGDALLAVEPRLAELTSLPVLQSQQTIAIILGLGIIGAALAAKFYEPLITAAATAIGAGLLSTVLPLWRQALTGQDALGASATEISAPWFAAVFLSGLGVQLYRYREEFGLAEMEPTRE